MKADVLIAGAGPVGLTMASELARYGLSVRLVDKNTERTDKSKALVLWARTLELMERMGTDSTQRFIDAGLKIQGANILSGRVEIAHVEMTHIASRYNFVLMIPQSETERLLEEHLETLGLKAERQVELKQLKSGADGVSCTLLHSDGREETAEASWLIGCDGAHSTVRHQLGMEFLGSTMLSDWILADIHLSGVAGAPAINIFWHAEGVLALFPLRGTRYRVIADIGESSGSIGEGNRPAPTLEEVQRILEVRGPGGIRASDPVWLSSFSINERKVSDYRSGRIFLAGDAAHVHSPAGGQGMNTGMQDAINLAWKLALVSRGICAPEPLLSSYSAERSAIAKLVLEATGKTTVLTVLKGGIKQSIRNHIASLVFGLAPVKSAMANILSEMAVGYPESPLNAKSAHVHGGPHPGQRAPIREGEPAVGSGNTPRFALFAEDTPTSKSLLSKYPNFVEPLPRKPYAHGGIWIVRPDGYVALAAKHDAWNDVDAYLSHLCTG
ncbi:MAG TPA: FAD-dependent monooxygenase [Chthoniobacterales bacterium]|jgi:2-polyprenyl-6-methoxyphenol hydroxylase-like FAD-dependent oxidoreductase|nr:FAD-dependent monooxygenase [Chthoniobacterales bacterium]